MYRMPLSVDGNLWDGSSEQLQQQLCYCPGVRSCPRELCHLLELRPLVVLQSFTVQADGSEQWHVVSKARHLQSDKFSSLSLQLTGKSVRETRRWRE